MLFQTWTFGLFLLPLLVLFTCLRKASTAVYHRCAVPLLLLASYVFYACWEPRCLVFLLVITLADYGFGRGIAAFPQRRGLFLCGSLFINLGMLGTFKYLSFITENLCALLNVCKIEWECPEIELLLPIGLSFITFKSLSYVIDVSKGKIRTEKNLLDYAAYVAFFPQLLAGPIERAGSLLPQLHHRIPVRTEDFTVGGSLFISGLFKKIVMADMLAIYVDKIFDDPISFSGLTLLLSSYAFSWQIYFDFSGYSDMACGVARLLGFRTVQNFDNPYVSTDIREFWRRWHISLSTWFRDYVYIPLGGSRCGKLRVWFNLLVTMLVSGLWHGAAWTFVAWGGLHGVGNVFSSWFDKSAWYSRIPRLVKQILVFQFMTFTWIFFRATSFTNALDVLRGIFTWTEGDSLLPAVPLVLTLGIWGYELLWASRARSLLECRAIRLFTLAVVLLLILLLGGGANSQFIYQQF